MLPLLPQLLGLDEFASVVTSWNQYKSGGKGNDRSNVLSAHSTLKINTATKTDPNKCLDSDTYTLNIVSIIMQLS